MFEWRSAIPSPDLGLAYMRARWYPPATGRFISQDPIAGSASAPQTLNPYAYVANNPCNARDPSGLQTGGGGGAGGSGAGATTLATPGGTGAGSVATRALGNVIAERPVSADLFGPAGVSSCVMPAPATKATPIVVPQFRLPPRTFGDGTLGGELKSLFAYVAQIFQAAVRYLGDLAAFFQNLATQAPAIAGRALLCAAHGIGAALMAEDNGQWRSAPLTLTARDSGRTGLLGLPGSQSAQSSSSPLLASPCIPGAIACPRLLPGMQIPDALKKLLLAIAALVGIEAATRQNRPAEPNWVVRAGVAESQRLQEATREHSGVRGLHGFSVQYSPGRTINELAAAGRFSNRQISVATAEELAAAAARAGYAIAVIPSPGQNLYHATLQVPDPLPYDLAVALSAAFRRMPNPAWALRP